MFNFRAGVAIDLKDASGRTRFRPLVPLAFCLVLFLVIPMCQKAFFSPSSAFMGGSYNGDFYINRPLFVAATYCAAVFGLLSRYPGDRYTEIISKTRLRLLTALVAIGCATVLSFGITSYWYATQSGITLYPGWKTSPVRYSWSDVETRSVGCYRSARSGVHIRFTVELSDGRTLDIYQANFVNSFASLTSLTSKAETHVGDIVDCPKYIQDFVSNLNEN